MQEAYLFEYAVLRVVPKVDREEFVNTGVILYCKEMNFLRAMITMDRERIEWICRTIDLDVIAVHLLAFDYISIGNPEGGPIAKMDMASRFRWLTATRSTVIQASKVHPGFCTDPQATLQRLHAKLVL